MIPGVAIATALMPPLCTAGYGLATAQYRYFFGAFYLFTLNVYFICLASVIVLLILKVPQRAIVAEEKRRKAKRRIIVSTVIVLIPSLLFGARLIRESDITGFEEQAHMEMQELGDEATILFPQVSSISVSAGYAYRAGEVRDESTMLVTLHAPLSAEQESALRAWLARRYPLVDSIALSLEN